MANGVMNLYAGVVARTAAELPSGRDGKQGAKKLWLLPRLDATWEVSNHGEDRCRRRNHQVDRSLDECGVRLRCSGSVMD